MPRAAEPVGVRTKLLNYTLDPTHARAGAKARGLRVRLGIEAASIDHLETEIREGILRARIATVRPNPPWGFNCAVDFEIGGVGGYSARTAGMRTVWLVAEAKSRPALITAFLR